MSLAFHANDEEDLAVISTYLQDAVGVMADMAYQPKQRRFVLVVSRFVWEREAKAGLFSRAVPQRVRTGIHFDYVEKVQVRGLPQREKDAAFDLLAIHFEGAGEDGDPSGVIELAFAGGGTLRLSVECINAFMTDMGEPWPVKSRPRHPGA